MAELKLAPVAVECPACGQVIAVPLDATPHGRQITVDADMTDLRSHVRSHRGEETQG